MPDVELKSTAVSGTPVRVNRRTTNSTLYDLRPRKMPAFTDHQTDAPKFVGSDCGSDQVVTIILGQVSLPIWQVLYMGGDLVANEEARSQSRSI